MQRYSPVVWAFLFIFVVSNKAADNTPPRFVYRADFRDYEHLFASGFKTLGRNDNLEDHIRGISCQDGELKNSAFTATTSEEEFAIKWAGDRLWMRENYASHQFVYVYKIRASENFYCSYSSLMKAFEDTKEKPYKRLADFFKSENEWVAYKGIPSDQVKEVAIYERGQREGTLALVKVEKNKHYKEKATAGNSQVYPVKKPLLQRVFLLASSIPNLSKCFEAPICPGTRVPTGTEAAEENDAGQSMCNSRLDQAFETSITTDEGTIWDPISDGPKKRLIPWKDEHKTMKRHKTSKPIHCSIGTGPANSHSQILEVDCPVNEFYNTFNVLLEAGIGDKTLIHEQFKNAKAGELWQKSDKQIHVLAGGSMKIRGYKISQVFSDADGRDWWSQISVFPLFPTFNPHHHSILRGT